MSKFATLGGPELPASSSSIGDSISSSDSDVSHLATLDAAFHSAFEARASDLSILATLDAALHSAFEARDSDLSILATLDAALHVAFEACASHQPTEPTTQRFSKRAAS